MFIDEITEIQNLSKAEVLQLYRESLTLEVFGVIPEEALLRKLTIKFYGVDTVRLMTKTSLILYKCLADVTVKMLEDGV